MAGCQACGDGEMPGTMSQAELAEVLGVTPGRGSSRSGEPCRCQRPASAQPRSPLSRRLTGPRGTETFGAGSWMIGTRTRGPGCTSAPCSRGGSETANTRRGPSCPRKRSWRKNSAAGLELSRRRYGHSSGMGWPGGSSGKGISRSGPTIIQANPLRPHLHFAPPAPAGSTWWTCSTPSRPTASCAGPRTASSPKWKPASAPGSMRGMPT